MSAAIKAAVASAEATMPTNVASAVVRISAAGIAMMGLVRCGLGRTCVAHRLEGRRLEKSIRAGTLPSSSPVTSNGYEETDQNGQHNDHIES